MEKTAEELLAELAALRAKEKVEIKGNPRWKIEEFQTAISHPRNAKLGFLMPDGEYECIDAELVSLKAKDDKIPGMRVKTAIGKWISIYLSSLENVPPFPDDNGIVIVPFKFYLRIKEGAATIGV